VNFASSDCIDIVSIPDDMISNKSLVKDTVEMVDNDSDDSV
jgi:hypothetical protein